MSQLTQGGVQADFDGVESALHRVKGLLTNPTIKAELFTSTANATQWMTDFYPPVRQRRPKFRFATRKQQRWFWWAVKKKLITVPYVRTRNLAQAVQLEGRDANGTGFTLLVTVNQQIAPYAQHVIGKTQLPGHKDTGWPLLAEQVKVALPDIVRQVSGGLFKGVRNIIRQGRPQ